jgi:hypothetical protein
MTIQAQSSKHPRKKIEEEIVTERRDCFTSEELGQWWRRGRGARSPPKNGGDRPEKWGHASAGNRPEKWGHASAGNQPEKKSWRSPENGGDWPENGGTQIGDPRCSEVCWVRERSSVVDASRGHASAGKARAHRKS